MSALDKSYDAAKALQSFYKIPPNFPLSGWLSQEKHFLCIGKEKATKGVAFPFPIPKNVFFTSHARLKPGEKKTFLGDRERKCGVVKYVKLN